MKYKLWPIEDRNKHFGMSAEEAELHFQWFLSSTAQRRELFLQITNIEPQPNPWDTKSVITFLDSLTQWLFTSCETTTFTQEEIDQRVAQLDEPIRSVLHEQLRTNPRILTPLGSSFCVDAQIIYLEILRARNPRLFWTYSKNKSEFNRNIPTLKSTSKAHEHIIYGLGADILLPFRRKGERFNLSTLFREDDVHIAPH